MYLPRAHSSTANGLAELVPPTELAAGFSLLHIGRNEVCESAGLLLVTSCAIVWWPQCVLYGDGENQLYNSIPAFSLLNRFSLESWSLERFHTTHLVSCPLVCERLGQDHTGSGCFRKYVDCLEPLHSRKPAWCADPSSGAGRVRTWHNLFSYQLPGPKQSTCDDVSVRRPREIRRINLRSHCFRTMVGVG